MRLAGDNVRPDDRQGHLSHALVRATSDLGDVVAARIPADRVREVRDDRDRTADRRTNPPLIKRKSNGTSNAPASTPGNNPPDHTATIHHR
jgi:hypothetical protein